MSRSRRIASTRQVGEKQFLRMCVPFGLFRGRQAQPESGGPAESANFW